MIEFKVTTCTECPAFYTIEGGPQCNLRPSNDQPWYTHGEIPHLRPAH